MTFDASLYGYDEELVSDALQANSNYERWGILRIKTEPELDETGRTVVVPAGSFFQVKTKSFDAETQSLLEPTSELKCIVLAMRQERQNWVNQVIDCRSLNGIYPASSNPYSSDCRTCPQRMKGGANRCKPLVSLLLTIPVKTDKKNLDGTPYLEFPTYRLQISTTGIRNTDMFVSSILNNAMKNIINMNHLIFVTVIKTQMVEGTMGKPYYVPVYPPLKFYQEQAEKIKEGKGLILGDNFKRLKDIYTEEKELFIHSIHKPVEVLALDAVDKPKSLISKESLAEAQKAAEPAGDVDDLFADE